MGGSSWALLPHQSASSLQERGCCSVPVGAARCQGCPSGAGGVVWGGIAFVSAEILAADGSRADDREAPARGRNGEEDEGPVQDGAQPNVGTSRGQRGWERLCLIKITLSMTPSAELLGADEGNSCSPFI